MSSPLKGMGETTIRHIIRSWASFQFYFPVINRIPRASLIRVVARWRSYIFSHFHCPIFAVPCCALGNIIVHNFSYPVSEYLDQYLLFPLLWSNGQSSWLQIQRFLVRSPALPDFLRRRGSLSLVSTTEELLGRNSSGSGLENRD
jgi:hypothetical protein